MNIAEIINRLTLEQKVKLLSGKSFWETHDIPEVGLPSIFMSDGPHGLRKQLDKADHLGLNKSHPATCFPTASALANAWDVNLIEKVGSALGKEAAHLQVSVLLGPGTNIKRNPLCGRNFEYFSEDPYLAGKMASSFIRGVEAQGVAACVKHFAANNQETKRNKIDSIIDERALQEIYLQAFEMAVKEGHVSTIMSAYNKLNGFYANENHHLLRDILREKWGFNGVVVTDWGGENDRVQGLIEGNDIEMPSSFGETEKDILEALRQGTLSEKYVDEAVVRLLRLIEKTKPSDKSPSVDLTAHHHLAREAAAQSAVLLENKKQALPLNKEEKVAIIGNFAKEPRYQGAGSSIVNPTQLVNTVDIIHRYDINCIGFEEGFIRTGKSSNKLLKKAISLAKNADTVLLYLGLDEHSEVEGIDRTTAKLPSNQLKLLDALLPLGKKVVVILSTGSFVEIDFAQKVDAILLASLSGQAGAEGILDVLSGHVNPSGKLSETYAKKYDDFATSKDYPSRIVNAVYQESIYVGYRYFDKVGLEVLYPFGHGLSYTDFAYSNLKVNKTGVTFTVKNIGHVSGAAISQLYVSLPNSRVFRAVKELKGFNKTVLAPNEAQEVHIPFDDYTFRVFDDKTNQFVVEKGDYVVAIGSSSSMIHLEEIISMDGVTFVREDAVEIPSYYAPKAKQFNRDEFAKLYGKPIAENQFPFINKKQNRMNITRETLLCELAYAKGWSGRFVAWAVHFMIGFLKFIGKRATAETLIMGVENMPLRSLSRMSSGLISKDQVTGLIDMFNGKFFHGLHRFISEGAKMKRERKRQLKAAEALRIAPKLAKHAPKEDDRFFTKFKKTWMRFVIKHEGWWQFIKFTFLSTFVTFLQIASKLVLDPLLANTDLANQTFQWIQIGIRANSNQTPFFIFDYPGVPVGTYTGLGTTIIDGVGGGLALFLSYYVGVALAQVVNFFLQRNVTFKSKGSPWYQAMWYLVAFVAITFLSQVILGLVGAPAYVLFSNWFGAELGKTIYDVIISGLLIPTISFWVYFPIFKIIFPPENKVVKTQ